MNKKLLILCLLTSMTVYNMEEKPKDQLGEIDQLSLQVTLEKKGFDTLKQRIERHEFEKSGKPHPFILFHTLRNGEHLKNNKKAELCKYALVVHMQLDTGMAALVFDTNEHNAKSSMKRIDYCTYIESVNTAEKTINIQSKFYDKKVLLQTLNSLQGNGQ